MNKRTKATLSVILSLGLLYVHLEEYHFSILCFSLALVEVLLILSPSACAAAIVKLVYQTQVYKIPDSSRNDSYFIWNSIELYVGILAASLPSLRPIFKNILETTKNMRSRRTGLDSSGNIGARHKYYIQEEIGMESFSGKGQRSGKYDATVISTSRSTNNMDNFGIKSDSDSDDILPLQGKGITKTVNVSIS